MVPTRVIPCLLLKGLGLVKTTRFKDPVYLGDPRNTVKIFNNKEVDELVLLDIAATIENKRPDLELVQEIVSEAFMPVAYGGGIHDIDTATQALQLGVEKIIFCTAAAENPQLVEQAAIKFGSQSVLVCIDAKKNFLGRYEVFVKGGRKAVKSDPVSFAKQMEGLGAGEVIINSIDRDGTMNGFDIDLIRMVTRAVHIPVVACGGAGKLEHFAEAVYEGGASAVAAGSLFVFQGKHRAVLISYPDQKTLRSVLP